MLKHRLAALTLIVSLALGASAALAADTAPTPRTTPRGNLVKVRPRVPQFPPDVKARGDQLWNAASPSVKAWASQNAPQVAKGAGEPEALARTAVQNRWSHVRTPGGSDTLTFIVAYDAAKEVQNSIKQDLDSMSGMGDTESLRLQMAMDRLSKLMTTLSNLLKKISTTQDSIIQHIK